MSETATQVKYWFGNLPKWVRATFWSIVITVIVAFITVGVILAIHWLNITFGAAGFFAICFVAMVFACAYITVWADMTDEQEKPKRGDE